MRRADALVVGGGPAGSTCAWALGRAGFDVVILDRARFPRDKVCAGWVTRPVFQALALDEAEYRAAGLVLQDIRGFRTAIVDGREVETLYDDVVSYAVRRVEFDHFLLRRARARVFEGTPLVTLRRAGDVWIANEQFSAPVVVGAGGHFCPVARHGRAYAPGGLVVARETEFRLPDDDGCPVRAEVPELFFCRDLDGYGWCVRKGMFLNVGIGRRDRRAFARHVDAFLAFLVSAGKLPRSTPPPERWCGHAYLLAGAAAREPAGDGLLLVGDAAGLAVRESGEGIRPAVESALLAAQTLIEAGGRFGRDALWPYVERTRDRRGPLAWLGRALPPVPAAIGRQALTSRWFTRHMVLNRWFLRAHEASEGQPNLRKAA